MGSLGSSTLIDFSLLPEGDIADWLQKNHIGLTVSEILHIQNTILKRPPTLTECILWSIQGSEHSSYKSSRPHLKQFATSGPSVMLGPGEDAGIVEVARDAEGHRYGIVMSHESHNSPSQIVPYEGAATGVGGNVRDVACMGAKVIASADPLRFGDIAKNKTKWLTDGVVAGIAGYGNPIGVPIIAGDIYFDKSYDPNCLVNVVTLGVVRDDEIIHSRAPSNADGYNLILVGKPTDNSGFGGASFSSVVVDETKKETNSGAVQQPNAFLKRHLLKASYELFKILKAKNLIDQVGFKDLGAGGIACVSVELADAGDYGAEVNLDLVPTSMDNLAPAVILCSETQERFMWVASPEVTPLILEHYNKTFDLPKIAGGAQAKVVGTIRDDGQYIVTFKGEKVVDAPAKEVTRGLVYDRPHVRSQRELSEPDIPEPIPYCHPEQGEGPLNANNALQLTLRDSSAGSQNDKWTYNDILLKILSHENVASREPIYEHYDKNVQGITVIEPGEADSGVMQPFKDETYPAEIRSTGVALSVDQNPRYCLVDAYWGGVNAVVEAMRNVAAVGAYPVALTDCLNFGNPEKPEDMGVFIEGVRGVAEAQTGIHLRDFPDSPIPIISGNVSLYKPVAPSPIIACLGAMPDASKAITMHFKKADSVLFVIGERKDECGGSVYYSLFNEGVVLAPSHAGGDVRWGGSNTLLGANVPKPNLAEVERELRALTEAIQTGLILAAHDISDGGIATTLAEMSFRNEIGCDVAIPGELRTDRKLFGESGGWAIEVEKHQIDMVKNIFEKNKLELLEIGTTTAEKKLQMNGVVTVDLSEAKKMWTNGLREKL